MTVEEDANKAWEIMLAGRAAFRAILNYGGSMEEAYFAANQAIQLWQKENSKATI